uniref:Putative salivary lipocalin n=1 Tax=Ixodes ricinus TaxID=34613 RepID=A0A6B0V0H5_IXORI
MRLLVFLTLCSFEYCISISQNADSPLDPTKDAWTVMSQKKKFYLLYRSNENDTLMGETSKCVQTKYYEIDRAHKTLKNRILYRNNETGHMEENAVLITIKKSNDTLPYYDIISVGSLDTTISATRDYVLLFTDNKTCHTVRSVDDDQFQVWMTEDHHPKDIDQGCEKAYQDAPLIFSCPAPREKYYIYNQTICN